MIVSKKILTAFLLSATAIVNAHATVNTKPAATPATTLTVESGKVEFLAIGKPSFLKVNGTGHAPQGTMTIADGKASGEFTFELASLDTKNDTRTGHMKDKYLEIEKFPKATIKFKDVAITGEKVTADVPAQLSLHGETKPITLKAELSGADKKIANGTFKIKLSDYGIAIPSYASVTIADEVTVTIESVLK